MGIGSGKCTGTQTVKKLGKTKKKRTEKAVQYSIPELSRSEESVESNMNCLYGELREEIRNVNLRRSSHFHGEKTNSISQGSPSSLIMKGRTTSDKLTQGRSVCRIEKSLNVRKDCTDQCNNTCCLAYCGCDEFAGKCSPRCRALTIGTAEYRNQMYLSCRSMLIGGSRVRVKKDIRGNL